MNWRPEWVPDNAMQLATNHLAPIMVCQARQGMFCQRIQMVLLKMLLSPALPIPPPPRSRGRQPVDAALLTDGRRWRAIILVAPAVTRGTGRLPMPSTAVRHPRSGTLWRSGFLMPSLIQLVGFAEASRSGTCVTNHLSAAATDNSSTPSSRPLRRPHGWRARGRSASLRFQPFRPVSTPPLPLTLATHRVPRHHAPPLSVVTRDAICLSPILDGARQV